MSYTLTNLDELSALYPPPSNKALNKRSSELSDAQSTRLAQSSLCVIASTNGASIDCSPRGDTAGQLVRVLDSTTLVMPDRAGSHRLDTAKNVIKNGKVALWFLSADWTETVKVSGDAHISVDPTLLQSFALAGVLPITVMVVSINEVATHNDRAIKHSGLF